MYLVAAGRILVILNFFFPPFPFDLLTTTGASVGQANIAGEGWHEEDHLEAS